MPHVVTIDQDGRAQTFVAHYWRYHSEYHFECDSLEEAQGFLRSGADDGWLAACCVVYPDGTRREYTGFGELGDPEPVGDHYQPELPPAPNST